MFDSANTRLLKIRFKQSYSTGRRLSMHGEMEELEYDLETELTPAIFPTWVDLTESRRVELKGTNTSVMGVWECRSWIQDKIYEKWGRYLKIGDLVQFEIRDSWFTLGEMSVDRGIYNYTPFTAKTEGVPVPGSISYQRFNLLQSMDVKNA